MPDNKTTVNKLLLFALYQNKKLSSYRISRLLGRSRSFIYTNLLRYKIPILNICQPDIVISNHKLLIQCDGDWWHANPKLYNTNSLSTIQRNNIKRDECQNNKLKEEGWHIMRFWGSEIKEDVSSCVDKIEAFLKRKASG